MFPTEDLIIFISYFTVTSTLPYIYCVIQSIYVWVLISSSPSQSQDTRRLRIKSAFDAVREFPIKYFVPKHLVVGHTPKEITNETEGMVTFTKAEKREYQSDIRANRIRRYYRIILSGTVLATARVFSRND